jgi:hypothetical protein
MSTNDKKTGMEHHEAQRSIYHRPSVCGGRACAGSSGWRAAGYGDLSAGLLDYSDEKGSYLLNRFKEHGIVDTVKSGFNDRIVVADHLAIEGLPRGTPKKAAWSRN